MQNDPEFFPDPDNFIPERFDDDNQKNQDIYMPFGEGPRQCIGEFMI
jgi:cytochrome P450 family 6